MAKKALFTVTVDEDWFRDELEYYNDIIADLTDEQRDEIIKRVTANDSNFAVWFENCRMRDFDTMYGIINEAVHGFINHVASDILPEPM